MTLSTLRYVATLSWEIKNSNFGRYSADMQENANKLYFKCADLNSSARVTVYAECIYVFLSKSCFRCCVPCSLLTNTAATSAMTNFRCHKLIANVSKQKTVTWKILFATSMKKNSLFETPKISKICG